MLELTAVYEGALLGRVELVDLARVRIGRARDNDFVVAVSAVSRWHAEVEGFAGEVEGEERWVIRDCGSRHGTLVGGLDVSEAELEVGMSLKLGPVELRVSDLGIRIGRELEGWLGGGAGVDGLSSSVAGLSATGELPTAGSIGVRRSGVAGVRRRAV